ncbi:MAG TPA: hypothetical protein VKE51_26380 [Vicinamibacterales bacterium]|nr:hypothetical protein [Vicinamibacterales bacterium]
MPSLERPRPWNRLWLVASIYLATAIVMTWPLATVMHRRIAGDMGDPLFVCWVILWTSGQILRALAGDPSALAHYWSGNIYHPAPLTVAYSEHLTPQMLQALPVLAITDNVILAYNLLLLATYVLSALGAYLLVRDVTGQPLAAFFAGLAFAFSPYRLDQYSHLQVLSCQWMPFTLYGWRRYAATGRLRPLVLGTAALVAQALSSIYYLAYFTPFAVAYLLYELAAHGTLRDRRTWRRLAAAGAIALLVVAMFTWPYVQVRRLTAAGTRDVSAIQLYSFDTHAFATITQRSRLLSESVKAMPRIEGAGFPGFTTLVFAAVAVGVAFVRGAIAAWVPGRGVARWRRGAAAILAAAAILTSVVLGDVLVYGRATRSMTRLLALDRDAGTRLIVATAVAVAGLLLVWPVARRWGRTVLSLPAGFCAFAAVAAAWLSLGPVMHANGRAIGPGPYSLFYRVLPGFDALRVPSRNLMIASLFLSILAGIGAAAMLAWRRHLGRVIVGAAMIAALAETWTVPSDINVRFRGAGLAWPPREIAGAALTPTYRLVRALPPEAVVAEFPFGDLANEIRYVFYAGYHRRAIVNGYSGFAPEHYRRLLGDLSQIPTSDEAWTALAGSGATHAIVHEGAYLDRDGRAVSAWLRREGAREIADLHPDHVFELPAAHNVNAHAPFTMPQ